MLQLCRWPQLPLISHISPTRMALHNASDFLVQQLQEQPFLIQHVFAQLRQRFWVSTAAGCIVQLDAHGIVKKSRPKVSIAGDSYSVCRVFAAWQWCCSRDPKLQSHSFSHLQASHRCHNKACINASHICVETMAENDARVACSLYGQSIRCPHSPACITNFSAAIITMHQLVFCGRMAITAPPPMDRQALQAVLAYCQAIAPREPLKCLHYKNFEDGARVHAGKPARCPEAILRASCMLSTFGLWYTNVIQPTAADRPALTTCSFDSDESLTLSHRCGNPWCFALGHIVQEPMKLNLSRKTCHHQRDAAWCFHSPPCLFPERPGRLPPVSTSAIPGSESCK